MNVKLVETIKRNQTKKIQEIITILDNYKVILTSYKRNEERKSILNDYSDNIYVINLKNDKVRRNYIKMLFKKLNIEYTLVVVEPISDELFSLLRGVEKQLSKSEVGCSLSHLWCLKHITENKYKGGSIIFEDDIVVHKNFESMFEHLFKEKHFDFLSMGACDFDFFDVNYKNVKNGLYQPCLTSKRCYGAHANYYSPNGAKYIFKLKSLFFSFFDNNFSSIFKHFNTSAFITYPNLFVTELSTSNINHKYHFYSSYEVYFYSKCFTNFKFQEYRFLYLCMIQKLADYCERNKVTSEINESSIVKLMYNTLNDIPNEEKTSLLQRIDLDFFTCKDILFIIDSHRETSV